ncbi:MAG: hypothetical protein WCA07_05405, partial [Gloeobacterales cyanobacterium]
AWVTKGREIENYVGPNSLEEAVKKVHKDVDSLHKTGQFDHCLPYKTKTGDIKDKVDKVKVAHEVIKNPLTLRFLI